MKRSAPLRQRRLNFERCEDRRVLAQGDLDLTFGGGDGIASFTSGFSSESAAVDAAGNYVVASRVSNGVDTDFALVRYTPAGAVDTTFGGGDGIVSAPIGPGNDAGRSVAVDLQGRYLVAGNVFNGVDNDFGLARFTATGVLDTTFGGGDGVVFTNVAGSHDSCEQMIVDEQGNYLLAGYSQGVTGYEFSLVRYTSAGVLDTTFGGGDGIVTADTASGDEGGFSLAVDQAGRYVVAGQQSDGFVLVRFTSTGALDTTFGGGDGVVDTPLGLQEFAHDVAVDAAGNYILSGRIFNGSNYDLLLARYTPSGTVDTTFGGGDGWVSVNLPGDQNANGVAVDSLGNYVTAGSAGAGSFLARFTPAGVLDTTFAGDGIVDPSSAASGYDNVLVDAGGRYIVAGAANFGIARYEGAPIDTTSPTVTGTTPSFATSGSLAAGTTTIQVTFSEPVLNGGSAANYELRRAGADGLLLEADTVINPSGVSYSASTATLTFSALVEDVYRLTVKDAITDAVGNALDGDANGTAGGVWRRDFVVGALSTTLTSPAPNSYPFDIEFGGFGAGQLVQGPSGSFDGLNRLVVNGEDHESQLPSYNVIATHQIQSAPNSYMTGSISSGFASNFESDLSNNAKAEQAVSLVNDGVVHVQGRVWLDTTSVWFPTTAPITASVPLLVSVQVDGVVVKTVQWALQTHGPWLELDEYVTVPAGAHLVRVAPLQNIMPTNAPGIMRELDVRFTVIAGSPPYTPLIATHQIQSAPNSYMTGSISSGFASNFESDLSNNAKAEQAVSLVNDGVVHVQGRVWLDTRAIECRLGGSIVA